MNPAPKKAKILQLAVAVARVGLGLVFAWAAIGKLGDPATFADDIANYRLVPASWVGPIAVTVPGVELTVAALLIVGACTRAAAVITSGMLVVFTVAIVQALGRGVNLSCGCFGGTLEPASKWTVVRDLVLLAWAALVAGYGRGEDREDRAAEPTRPG